MQEPGEQVKKSRVAPVIVHEIRMCATYVIYFTWAKVLNLLRF